MRFPRIALLPGLALLIGLTIAPATGASAPAAQTSRAAVATPFAVRLGNAHWAQPPTPAQCIAALGLACYRPSQFQQAYDLKSLYAAHLNGRGRTIVIVDSFGSPTIMSDLATFDQNFHLPAPPNFTVLQPVGKVPPFDPSNATMVNWAVETSLDVEYSHAMAPGANIVLLETPVAETEGTIGFPQIIAAENYAINNHLGDVISQSFGATEQTFPSPAVIQGLRSAYFNAVANNVTVIASSGDNGVTNAHFNGTMFTHRVGRMAVERPVGYLRRGSAAPPEPPGRSTMPDNVWNESYLFGNATAGGGGVSAVFGRPTYQDGVKGTVGLHRGTPDVSLSAAVNGAALVYMSFAGLGGPAFYLVGGTSEAAPQFAGIVAIADQAAGHDLGLLNPQLYAIGAGGSGLPDITTGNNTVTFNQNGRNFTVPGFNAVPGYDMASGLGTVDGAQLVAALTGK